MTGQARFDSYLDAGVFAAVGLVNGLSGTGAAAGTEALRVIGDVLVIDPASVAMVSRRDVPAFTTLAEGLRAVFEALDSGDVDSAANDLNALLAEHPAHPHLAKEAGAWRLHHHCVDAALVPMWTAICAEALARVVGSGASGRLGLCARPGCEHAFVDGSKNGSRRFCSVGCQNRVKAAAFRRRSSHGSGHGAGEPGVHD